MKLFIVGMPGAGKSLLGKTLADFLDIPHIDTDDMIETRCSRSISQIFAEEGEFFFRRMERESLLKCLEMEGDIICSTGGGILEDENNRANLNEMKTIYIKKDIDDLLENLVSDDDKRPLLRNKTKEELKKLFDKRKKHFELFPSIAFNKEDIDIERLPRLLYHISDNTGFGTEKRKKTLKGVHPVVIRPFMAQKLIGESAYNITSESVYKLYQSFFQTEHFLVLPDREKAKHHENLKTIWKFLIDNTISKEEPITGFGGGTITDITGFACSTFKRGTAFNFVPTTLLSQVDASLGGKNAINFEGVKNVCGTFSFPISVFIDPLIVFSTNKDEIENGLIEGLKAALLVNEDPEALYSQLFLAQAIVEKPTLPKMCQFVEKAICDKMKIVNADPYEKSTRKFLNLGHSYGHVYEATYEIPHGKAVALGMLKILRNKRDPIIRDYCDFFKEVTKQELGSVKNEWSKTMQQRLLNDKKNTKDNIVFIDLEKPGKPFQTIVKKSDMQ